MANPTNEPAGTAAPKPKSKPSLIDAIKGIISKKEDPDDERTIARRRRWSRIGVRFARVLVRTDERERPRGNRRGRARCRRFNGQIGRGLPAVNNAGDNRDDKTEHAHSEQRLIAEHIGRERRTQSCEPHRRRHEHHDRAN